MKTVWKKELQVVTVQQIEIPVGSKILTVGEQDNNLMLWFLCDDDVELEKREIIIVGTGNNAPDNIEDYTYIATTILLGPPMHAPDPGEEKTIPDPVRQDGQYVFHVFEKTLIRQYS